MIIEGLHYSYPNGPSVLDGVSLRAPRGRLTCVAGANGSGKSTLLALLAGLLTPASGRISPGEDEASADADELRGLSALVLQDADLQILGATVREDLELGLDDSGKSKALALAGRLGLSGLLERPVQNLSWGQKRKLTLASALAREPKILLLDEPFGGLDYPGALEIRSILSANRRQGVTQVVAAHDLDPLADLADAAAVLHNGRTALLGAIPELAEKCAEYGVKPPGGAWPEAG